MVDREPLEGYQVRFGSKNMGCIMYLDGGRANDGDKSCLLKKGKGTGGVRQKKIFVTPGGLERASDVCNEPEGRGGNFVILSINSG